MKWVSRERLKNYHFACPWSITMNFWRAKGKGFFNKNLHVTDGVVQVDLYEVNFDALGLSIFCPNHKDSQDVKIEAVYIEF